jgi:hypothetical protein
MTNGSNDQAIPLSHQMLALSQQLVLLQMLKRVSEYLRDGVEESQISPLLNALDDCASAQSKNPCELTATFLDAIALFAEWERRELL